MRDCSDVNNRNDSPYRVTLTVTFSQTLFGLNLKASTVWDLKETHTFKVNKKEKLVSTQSSAD